VCVGTTNQIKDGSIVRRCRVADKTGSIYFSLWNEQAEAVESGDILRLVKGYASLWKGTLVLYSGKYGQLEKIGEFTMVFSELPDMSDPSHDFAQQHQREDGRIGHHISRNGSNGVTAGGENHGGSGQKNSGRLGLGQHADGRRSYTSSPTGDYRPSPHHTHISSQPSQQTHSLLVPTSHMHPTHSLLPPSVMGGPHGEIHHSQNLGPHRTRQETGGTRYHPYSIRR
jgi:hypothetical protein